MYDARKLATSIVAPVLALAAIASCGGSYSGNDDALLPERDGGPGAEASDDGGMVTPDATTPDAFVPPCDYSKPFDTPVPLTELNTNVFDIVEHVSADELTIYVGSNYNITNVQQFVYTRPNKSDPFALPRKLAFPAGAWSNWGVAVTADGLTAVLSSDRSGNTDLYVAKLNPTTAVFDLPPDLIAGTTNSSDREEGPHLSADGKTLYFDSTRGGNRNIYRVPVVGSTFGTAEAIAEVNSAAVDAIPVLSPDELTIYFLSNRQPTTDGDIYYATRNQRGGTFKDIQPLPGVNSTGLDAPAHISPDACTLYLTSDRAGNKSDVYVARRPK